jgi:hypothetical protein
LLTGFTLFSNTPCERKARNDRSDRRLTLWLSAIAYCRSSKGFCSIPSGFRKNGSECGEDFSPPGFLAPRMLWRGHENQGRCEPGRRAVLEENKEPSDRRYSTPKTPFSQAKINGKQQLIVFIFSLIELAQSSKGDVAPNQLLRYLKVGFSAQKSLLQIRIGIIT